MWTFTDKRSHLWSCTDRTLMISQRTSHGVLYVVTIWPIPVCSHGQNEQTDVNSLSFNIDGAFYPNVVRNSMSKSVGSFCPYLSHKITEKQQNEPIHVRCLRSSAPSHRIQVDWSRELRRPANSFRPSVRPNLSCSELNEADFLCFLVLQKLQLRPRRSHEEMKNWWQF